MHVDLLVRSESVKYDDDFFEKLIEWTLKDPNPSFIDPITYSIMVDPVVLSSGQVMDRKSALDDNGSLRFNECPMTRLKLDPKVYPLSNLKG